MTAWSIDSSIVEIQQVGNIPSALLVILWPYE